MANITDGKWAAYAAGRLPGPLAWRVAAGCLARVYAASLRLRHLLYDARLLRTFDLGVPVISVGNLVAGGTGKSPVAIRLAELLRDAGARPAILARGYGSTLQPGDSLALLGTDLVMPPAMPATLPDEARMQAAALATVPVVCGRDRVAAARRFVAQAPALAPTHWLLDDGFQHRRIRRDVDIVLLDADRPFGALPGARWHLLPRGLLRESPRALRRASFVVFTRATAVSPTVDAERQLRAYFQGPALPARFATGMPTPPPAGGPIFDPLAHSPVFAVCGIARPGVFLDALRGALGLVVAGSLEVGDHIVIDRGKLLGCLAAAPAARAVVTTAKDYWRDPGVFADLPMPAYLCDVHVDWDEAEVHRLLTRWL